MLLAAFFCQQAATMSSYKFTPRAVASPDAPQKVLVRKPARSGGAEWVQVSRTEPGRRAKKPRTAKSQPPACTHKEHHILSAIEATAFAAQYWDRKTYHMQDWEKMKQYVLSTNKGTSSPMGSQPCLKKAMQMMAMIQNEDDSLVQCHVCVHRPMCCAVLKNVTPCPPPPPIHF